MSGEPRGSSGCGLFVLAAVVLSALSVACWFVPGRGASLRVTAFNASQLRAHLLERAGSFDDVESRALAGDSDESFRARLTAGRSRLVSGAQWPRIFADLGKGMDGSPENLPEAWRDRVSPEDEFRVTAVFFPPDEAPFDALGIEAGRTLYLELDPEGMELLEVLHVPSGVRDGEVTTSRFYKSRWTLPTSIAWPLRRTSYILAGLAALALLAGVIRRAAMPASATTPQGEPVPDNPRRRSAWRSMAVALLMLGVSFVPALVSMDMMRGGFAIIFVAGFLMLSAFVVALMFFSSARRLDRMLSGEERIAHWVYAPDLWQRFVDVEYGLEGEDKRALFRFVAVIIVVVTGGFVLMMRDEASLWVAAGMGGLIVVLWLVATLSPGMQRSRQLQAPPEAWLGPAGMMIGNAIHDFTLMFGRIDRVDLSDVDGTLVLEISYSFLTRTGRNSVIARAPVPHHDLNEGRRVAEAFAALATADAGDDDEPVRSDVDEE